MPRFYDISLPVSEATITYPGDPPIRISPHARITDGDDANVTTLCFGSHTGTHVDAPHHFIDGAARIDELSIEDLIGTAVVVEIPAAVQAIGPEELDTAGIGGATRVLLKTRNSTLLGRDTFDTSFAYLTGPAAEYLVDAGVRLVGIDYLSIEEFGAADARAHNALLGKGVIVLEGVDLRDVPPGRYELICLPLRLVGLDGSPVRAILRS